MKRAASALLALAAAAAVLSPAASAQSSTGEPAVSSDGRQLYVAGWPSLVFDRNPDNGALTLSGEAPPGRSIALSPDGRNVYIGWRGVHVLTRDAATGALTHQATMAKDIGSINHIAISPDGRHLYAAVGSDRIVTLARDAQSGLLAYSGAIYGGPAAGDVGWLSDPLEIAVSPDGRSLYAGMANGLGWFTRDPSTGALRAEGLAATGNLFAVAASDDGTRVYAGMSGAAAWQRDLATGELEALPDGLSSPCNPRFLFQCMEGRAIAPSPDGTIVFATRWVENKLIQGLAVPSGLAHKQDFVRGQPGAEELENPLELAWSPDSRFLYATTGRMIWAQPGQFTSRGTPPVNSAIAVLGREPGTTHMRFLGVLRPDLPRRSGGIAGTATINDGARFTNSPHVTVTVTAPWHVYSARLSNDGLFAGSAVPLRQRGTYPWTLQDAGIGRDVRRVHVRLTDGDVIRPGPLPDVSDDIVLDTRPPALLAARAVKRGARYRLTLRARDNRSGVRRVQVVRKRSERGGKRRYRRRLALRRLPRHGWVRVFDGAGNPSKWRRVKWRRVKFSRAR